MNSSIICEDCGAKAPALAIACPKCGLKFEEKPDAPGQSFPLPPEKARRSGEETLRRGKNMRYASFLTRAAASIIDAIASQILINLPFTFALTMAGPDLVLLITGLSLLAQIGYFVLMTASSKQGTLGKMAVGIKVVDVHGDRITIGRAFGRYLSKILSVITLFIGFFMVIFTKRKQGLHDMVAGTLVIHK